MNRVISIALVTLAACGKGTGKMEITTYGEDYIEQQIPAQVGEEAGFVDGFSVTYEKFLVALSEIRVMNEAGEEGAVMSDQRIFDLTQAGPHPLITFESLEADHWDDISVAAKPARGAIPGNADSADVAMMNQGGYSIFVQGTATDGTGTYSFAWPFTTDTHYKECEDAEKLHGAVVPNGGVVTIQFTIHGDHFFYDDLQSGEPSLRFAPLAQVADADRRITLEALFGVSLDSATLPARSYGTGGDASVANLRQFEEALSRTIIHFQGEGECIAQKR